MKRKEEIKALFEKYLNGTCTPAEEQTLFTTISGEEDQKHWNELIENYLSSAEEFDSETQELVNRILPKNRQRMKRYFEVLRTTQFEETSSPIGSNRVHPMGFEPAPRRIWNNPKLQWRVAAAAILLISFSFFYTQFYNKITNTNTSIARNYGGDAQPVNNHARLTFADGKTIPLSDTQSGIIIGDQDIKYTDGSELFVIQSDSEGSLPAKHAALLTLSTPKAGQYQITLPDGTKVWLNAASTLKYPSRFSDKERRVELTGEAYFEVAHNKKQPFVVHSDNQEVKVLGTHFNINAYSNEANTKTTLLEGSVQVSLVNSPPNNTTILTPNQQSTVTGTTITTQTVNTEDITAWKSGTLIFRSADIQTIMRQVERWYDVQVVYEGTISTRKFYGGIAKGTKLSVLLSIFKDSNISFRIEDTPQGKKLFVKP